MCNIFKSKTRSFFLVNSVDHIAHAPYPDSKNITINQCYFIERLTVKIRNRVLGISQEGDFVFFGSRESIHLAPPPSKVLRSF